MQQHLLSTVLEHVYMRCMTFCGNGIWDDLASNPGIFSTVPKPRLFSYQRAIVAAV